MAYAKTPFPGLFDLNSVKTYFEYNKLSINIYWYYISGKGKKRNNCRDKKENVLHLF